METSQRVAHERSGHRLPLGICRSCVFVIATAVLVSGPQLVAAQSSPDDRIRALEARVAALEAMLSRVAADRVALDSPLNDLAVLTPPSSPPQTEEFAVRQSGAAIPQELLPNLGKIGAAASLMAGAQSGPFQQRAGWYAAGGIELPLYRVPGGRLMYEFRAGLGRSTTPMRVTSNVAQVANLAALANTHPLGGSANVEAALDGRPPAPFAVHYDVSSRVTLLDVTPFGLKYLNTTFDRWRLRPYAAGGLGFLVTISDQATVGGGASPFGGALIAGQVTAAQELAAAHVPSGQGNLDLGFQFGGGVEWRARPSMSLGFEVRSTTTTKGQSFLTTSARTALQF